METFLYTLVQVAHNFGAAAVAGSPIAALWFGRENDIVLQRLSWLMALGWLVQAVSGIGFAVTSYTMDGSLRHVEGIALVALALKVCCTLVGTVLAAACLMAGSRWSAMKRLRLCKLMITMTSTALVCAAVLRWYS